MTRPVDEYTSEQLFKLALNLEFSGATEVVVDCVRYMAELKKEAAELMASLKHTFGGGVVLDPNTPPQVGME